MKICLINNLYPPYARGGAEKVTAALASSYRAGGHEVFIITTAPEKYSEPEGSDIRVFRLKSDFYNLGFLPVWRRFFWHIGNLLSAKKYKQIKDILAQEKPGLVMTHNLMGISLQAARAIRRLKITHHHFLHDIQLLHPSGLLIFGREKMIDSWPARIYQSLTNLLIGSPALVISPSRWLLLEHQRRGFFKGCPAEIKRLEDIFSVSFPAPRPAAPLRRLFFAGQIEAHKGIFFLIEAFKSQAGADFHLRIAGDGSGIEQAKQQADSDPRIAFLGKLDQAGLAAEFAAADALVMPSLCYENYPLIIIEARAAGLPVVAAKLGGIPEAIGPGDQLFNPGDPEDLFIKLKSRA